jgi:[ribosomal protein S18]-alanine N-acetyltransferase
MSRLLRSDDISFMDLTIRRSRFSDLDEILKIEETSFPDPYDRPTFLHLLLSEPGGFLVAEEKGIILGYVVATTGEGRGLIVSIAVSYDHKRRGIGAKLLHEALAYLVDRRVEQVELQVGATNTAAIQMYEKKFYFHFSHRIRRYYHNGEDALVMVRQL